MVVRRKPEDLVDKRAVLDAMGRCRKAVIAAQDKVKPFGATYRALQVVTAAIDSAALFLTGDQTFYHAGGSAPGDHGKWRDSDLVG